MFTEEEKREVYKAEAIRKAMQEKRMLERSEKNELSAYCERHRACLQREKKNRISSEISVEEFAG